MNGPHDASGDPLIYKTGDGDEATVIDRTDGTGVKTDTTRSTNDDDSGYRYPEEMNGKHPKDLPPGHNGTPDTDLQNRPKGEDFVRGDDFDWYYDDPANDKDNPNDPGYTPPQPAQAPPATNPVAVVNEDETVAEDVLSDDVQIA